MNAILVTGGTGFIGSHLINRLAREGLKVRALVRNLTTVPAWPKTVEPVVGDVTDEASVRAAMTGVRSVFHLASILGPSGVSEATFHRINVEGTRTVLRCASEVNAGFVLHCSSCGVYGSVQDPPATELTPLAPEDPYERSKAEAELVALEWAGLGTPVVIVRPAWVYGPGDRRTLKLFRGIARKRFLMVGKAQNTQHPIYISDLIEGIWRCYEQQDAAIDQQFILAGPEIVTIRQLCEEIALAVGVKLPSLTLPLNLAKAVGATAELAWRVIGKEAPINNRKVEFFIKNRAYSSREAHQKLGFSPRVPLRLGVQQAVEFYRKAGWL